MDVPNRDILDTGLATPAQERIWCALTLILFGAFICDEWSRIIIMSRSADRRQYAIVVDDPSDMLFRIDQEC